MQIYMLRHAIAVQGGTPGFPNDDRPLTAEGITKMKKAAKGIRKNVDGFDLIVSSPLQRAYTTAKIVAEAFEYGEEIKITKHLLPGELTQDVLNELSKYKNKERVLLVGHSPDLGGIASALLGGHSSIVEFKKGGMCRIDIDTLPAKRPGRLVWLLSPKQLRGMNK